MVRRALERAAKSSVNICLQMCIWNCLCQDTQLNGVLLHSAIFHCVYLAITKATLVKLKLAIVFLLIYIYIFFPPNSHVYGLFALLTAGLVSAFAFKKGGGGDTEFW